MVLLDSAGAEVRRVGGFNLPIVISTDSSDGSCWVADLSNNQVARVAADGTELVRESGFNLPRGISANVSDGSCWVADSSNNQIVHISSDGTELWRGGGFNWSWGVAANPTDGSCWVADTNNSAVVLLAEDGTELWSGPGFNKPYSVSVNPTDGSCWVADSGNGQVVHLAYQYSLSLDATNGGIEVDTTPQSLPWSGDYISGTEVTLEAMPDSTYEFTSWSGDLSGSENPTTVTVDSDMSITANFSKIYYTLSIQGSGSGSVYVDGIEKSLPWSGGVASGTTVELTAVSDPCYSFSNWTGDLTGASNPKSLTMTGPKSVTANFSQLSYDLDISGLGAGSVSVDGIVRSLPWSGTFDCGDTVTLEAVPDSCWQFGNWSGDLTGSDSPAQIVIDGEKNVTANFGQIEYTLSIDGIGSGSIVVAGTPHSLPWSDTFVCGSAVTVEAVPNSCYQFDSWSGDLSGDVTPRVVTMSAAKSITANFSTIQYSLNLTGDEGGTVTADGVSHTLPWSGSFDCGSVVTLDAVADSCHEFTGWTGSITWENSPVDIVMDGDKNIAAGFSILTYTVTISGDAEGQVSVDGVVQPLPWSDTVDCGTTLALEATPDSCWQFDAWSGDLSSTDNPVSLVVDGTKAVSAGFSETEYSLSVDGAGGSILVDGSPQSLPWSGSYICGSSVTLEAVPDEHREFAGWSGDLSGGDNPVELVMDGDRSIVESFDWVTYTLSLNTVGNGTVSVDGAPQTLPWSGGFPYGTEVALEAAPADGWKFKGWSGAISGSETAVTVTVDGDIGVGATFTEIITFDDVSEDYWAYDSINACIDAGIVFGYDDGLYRPELKVTRAAMAVYIARGIAGGQENVPAGPEEPTFPDVGVDHWAYDGIEYAVAANVVTGYGDSSYQPSWVVTRAQMSAFVARAIVDPTGEEGLADYTPPTEPTFTDVPTTYWCFAHVEYLAENDIVSGYADGYYRPTADVTREQMAVYIARAFGLVTP